LLKTSYCLLGDGIVFEYNVTECLSCNSVFVLNNCATLRIILVTSLQAIVVLSSLSKFIQRYSNDECIYYLVDLLPEDGESFELYL